MQSRRFLTNSGSRTRIALIGIGVVLLVLTVNQLLWQRWGFAAVQGSLCLAIFLAGFLLSDVPLQYKSTQDLLKIMWWNVLFVASVVVVAISVDRDVSDFIGISMPYIGALWLLVLGTRFANKRRSVVAIAMIAGLLLLLQCAIFGVGILLSPYHFQHRNQMQLLVAAVLTTGVPSLWWFLHTKLSRVRMPG